MVGNAESLGGRAKHPHETVEGLVEASDLPVVSQPLGGLIVGHLGEGVVAETVGDALFLQLHQPRNAGNDLPVWFRLVRVRFKGIWRQLSEYPG